MTPHFLLAFSLLAVILSGCGSIQTDAPPPEVQTTIRYIQALADKDEASYSDLICPTWATEAFLEFDAYQGVEARLDEVNCRLADSQQDSARVSCDGKINLSYRAEKQEVDLSGRTYELVADQGEWFVCGIALNQN